MLFLGIVAAITTFLFFQNRQYNRTVDRRNRILEKQEEIMELLRKKAAAENNENTKDEN